MKEKKSFHNLRGVKANALKEKKRRRGIRPLRSVIGGTSIRKRGVVGEKGAWQMSAYLYY